TGILLGLVGAIEPSHTVAFTCLILAAAAAGIATPQSTAADRASLPFSVFAFAALLLFGGHPAALVAASGAIAHVLASERPRAGRILWNAAAVVLAAEAAGFVHAALGGARGHFAWPWQAIPIGA